MDGDWEERRPSLAGDQAPPIQSDAGPFIRPSLSPHATSLLIPLPFFSPIS